ncbi:hypothetical protein PR202_gb28817 [Eleusine coracana subsp. coracana]|uniref:GPI-anchored protein LLG1-like domain-containing protein n=1 Tax=Eleusine coracana subsp. coracana TaxID=191504 RepID=A0AAV5FY86_ELECO|nr:hypothetical protein PR202_gb28817 [Eleusine coracana subsp. coracana]
MFSYITIYGKYPPGLFSSTCCQENKGLDCAEEDPQIQQGKEEDSFGTTAAPSAVAALMAGVAALLLMS